MIITPKLELQVTDDVWAGPRSVSRNARHQPLTSLQVWELPAGNPWSKFSASRGGSRQPYLQIFNLSIPAATSSGVLHAVLSLQTDPAFRLYRLLPTMIATSPPILSKTTFSVIRSI